MSAALLRNEVIVSAEDLRSVRDEFENHAAEITGFAAVLANGETRELPKELSAIFNLTLRTLAANGSVSVATLPDELTSNTAAEVLGVSRPTILKLANEGQIESFKVGSHRRFKREAVLAFKARREQARRVAMEEFLKVEDELGD
ncbi:helix-turn-helix domain-containing protein [Glutamicibacter endophyticus]|uniref:helix-turn-helix domain-containing protein n=1 Tax=Glutamicibacter endophyticus TaxID=1522174 RepID=UPI003AF11FF0